MSSDNILPQQYHGKFIPYTFSPSQNSTLLHLQQATDTHEDNKKTIPERGADNQDMVRPIAAAAAMEEYSHRQKQFDTGGPFITDKQYNTSCMVHGSNYCYPVVYHKVEKTSIALFIPKKSSQRKQRASPPAPLACTEPIRDSSLNATSSWRNTNSSFSPKCFNNNEKIIPASPPLSDKSANRTFATLVTNKRVS